MDPLGDLLFEHWPDQLHADAYNPSYHPYDGSSHHAHSGSCPHHQYYYHYYRDNFRLRL